MVPAHPVRPEQYRVVERTVEASDVVSLTLAPLSGAPLRFAPGQFNMLTAFGVGEAAISLSGTPGGAFLTHTVRDVGCVTSALCGSTPGTVVGVRGPYGRGWAVDELVRGPGAQRDVVVMAGGIGLAPLRGAIRLLAAAGRGGRLVVLVGARTPDQLVFATEFDRWREQGADVSVTVDRATSKWRGSVGLVTSLVDGSRFDPSNTAAFICGPEVMMRFSARALTDRGVDPGRIELSLERSMRCGVGWCGHCQLGPLLVCRDGPVVGLTDLISQLLSQPER